MIKYRCPYSNATHVFKFKVPYCDEWQYLSARQYGKTEAETLAEFKKYYNYAYDVSIEVNAYEE